jgi:hypothetical protein
MATTTHAGTEARRKKHRLGVQELIRKALDETEGNESAAIALLVDQALEDNDYIRELFGLAVQALNRHARSSRRGDIRRAVQSTGSLRSLGSALARPLLEFPLQDGAMLKDAYQPQVERAAVQFGQQGDTMLHLARWLRSIHAKMDAGATVGESLDELTVRALFDETETF